MINKIHFGDCRVSLRAMAAVGVKVQTCVTSPPYFGLRDYGHAGQIGLEPTPDEFIAELVEVFRCVRDVLADDGTLWVNIGDSYSNAGTRQGDRDGAVSNDATNEHRKVAGGYRTRVEGCKNKDLIGIPWMLAFALRADGWYLRQEIIWHKPNPMPESVTDRCTKAHEQIFLLSKSPRYFFDSDAIKEPVQSNKGNGKSFRGGGSYTGNNAFNNSAEKERETHGNAPNESGMRNRRSVWSVATRPYKGAHFATFPPALIEPCILAGSCPGDVVLDPFMGSGTTAEVSILNDRQFVGCELNSTYGPLQDARIDAAWATVAKDLI